MRVTATLLPVHGMARVIGVIGICTAPSAFSVNSASPVTGPYYATDLFSLMGPVKRCCAMPKITYPERMYLTGPHKGQSIKVEVDTHVVGNLEFASGALAMIGTSFDVWGSELPRIEIYGTKGTICINVVDPMDSPKIFGGLCCLKQRKSTDGISLPN